jgi:predicted RNase H-like HicB family nuclease
MKTYDVLIEEGESGYLIATVKGLRGAHTQARTVTQLKRRVAEVVALCEAEAGRAPPAAGRRVRGARTGRIRGSYRLRMPM